ncbi:MAG: MFS transporter [Conexivisphaerales archaeon]
MQETITYTASEKRRTLIGVFLGYLFDGFDLQIISYLLPAMSASLGVSISTLSVAISYSLYGSVIGGFLFGWLADLFGRKRMLLLTILTFGLFTLLTGFATNVEQVYLLRFLAGLGIGGEWGIGFSLLNEAWKEKTRGKAGSVLFSMYPYGLLLAALTAGIFLARFGNVLGWRYSFFFVGLLSLTLLSLRFILPESKMWQAYMRSKKENRLPVGYDRRTPVIQIFSKEHRVTTLLISFFSAFALFGGYSMIVFIPTYLGRGGLHIPVTDYTLVISLALLIGTPGYFVDGYLSDKLGRKRAAQIFIPGLLITLLVMYYQILSGLNFSGILTFPFFYSLIAFDFFQGYFGHLGVWFGELYPTKVRATGSNFAFVFAGRGLGAASAPILIPLLLPYLQNLGLAMTIGGLIGATGALVISFFIKETKGTVISPV